MDVVGFVAFKLMDLEILFTELPVLVRAIAGRTPKSPEQGLSPLALTIVS